jgi:hypothetical protein
MPIVTTYPGVYIEEIPSGVRTIIGVSTSTAAFIGRALRGPVNEPVLIHSFADYERNFGGLWIDSTMSYAVQHYFLNGGIDAIIVRLKNGALKAKFDLPAESGTLNLLLEARDEGSWGNNLQITIDYFTQDPSDGKLFNMIIEETDPNIIDPSSKKKLILSREKFLNMTVDPNDTTFVGRVLAEESSFIELQDSDPFSLPNVRPAETQNPKAPSIPGSDGNKLTATQYEGNRLVKTGIFALEKADIFNMLCIPPTSRDDDIQQSTWDAAMTYCRERRAFLIIDPPSTWNKPSDVTDSSKGVDTLRSGFPDYGAVYFPRLNMPDPLMGNRLGEFVPCGVVAGIYARTDAQRGIWKAPAGIEATLSGVRSLTVKLTDGENGDLNPLGVNCLRTFPVIGSIVWGARTLKGADRLASEWKYIPIRRLALYIEESLYRGTQWVVFEPNDEPLWAQIRLNVGAFMHDLFRKGAFQGQTSREAYFVKCDKETTTQTDRNSGIVNILVGFAPLKPAEFVIIKIQQIAGQIQT